MPQIDLDEINLDDLFMLRAELSEFFNAHDAYEACYCDGSDDWIRLSLRAEDKFDAVRKRIRDLALDLGIHAEFLEEYELTRSKSRIAA